MEQDLYEACDQIDAALCTGDTFLFDKDARTELKEYCERWLRVINEHEENYRDFGD